MVSVPTAGIKIVEVAYIPIRCFEGMASVELGTIWLGEI
jgi:hypothetical protein